MLGKYNLYDIPLYSQIDPRWRNIRLGYSNLTIGSHGCVVCCLAMLLSSIGYVVDPPKVNEDMRRAKAFLAGTGRAIWAKVSQAYPLLQYKYQIWYSRTPDERKIGELADNLPVLTEILLRGQPHWVLTVRRDIAGLLVHDPLLPPAQQRRGYLHDIRPISRIRRIVVYDVVRA